MRKILPRTPRAGAVLTAAAAAALLAAAAWAAWTLPVYDALPFASYADRGELLFHGIRDKGIAFSMPLFSMLLSLSSYHWLPGMDLLGKAALFSVYALAYTLGAAGRRPLRGLAFALPLVLMDAAGAGLETEQTFYTFLLFVYLNAEQLRLARPGPAASLASGLALGMTLLVRSSLFAWPPAAAVLELLGRGSGRERLLRAALFLGAAYILLVPWIRVTGGTFGKFVPFEYERSTCNIVTAVKGSVFTMEGDCRALGGLKPGESAEAWAVRRVLANPLDYAGGVARRLWQVCLMFPWLLPLAAISLLLSPSRENLLPAALAGCFVLTHCLLSIEARYFYPLRYLLGILLAAGVYDALAGEAGGAREPGRPAAAALLFFAAPLLLCLVMERRLLAYPSLAINPLLGVNRELTAYPADPWLYRKRGTLLLGLNRTAEGTADLARVYELSGGREKDLRYITGTVASTKPPAPPDRRAAGNLHDLEVTQLLKELELGLGGEAVKTYRRVNYYWSSEKGSLKGLPYERDRQVLYAIKHSSSPLSNDDIYRALYFWPVERRAAIIAGLAQLAPLTPGLEFLLQESRCAAGRPEACARLSALDWKPGTGLDYAGTKLELTEAVLAGLELPRGGGLPYPLPAVLEAAGTALRRNGGAAALAGEIRGAGAGELGALLDLALAAPGGPAFRQAAGRLLKAAPGELAPLVIYLAAGADDAAAGAMAALERHPEAAVRAAGLLADAGRTAEALALCGWAAERGGARASGEAALLYQRLGEHARALAALDKAVLRGGGDAAIYNARGVELRFLGRAAEAEKDFLKAARLAPGAADARLNLASLRLAEGDRAGAAGIYRELLSLPGLAPALQTSLRSELAALE